MARGRSSLRAVSGVLPVPWSVDGVSVFGGFFGGQEVLKRCEARPRPLIATAVQLVSAEGSEERSLAG